MIPFLIGKCPAETLCLQGPCCIRGRVTLYIFRSVGSKKSIIFIYFVGLYQCWASFFNLHNLIELL